MYAVYDPRADRFIKEPARLATGVKYYTYDVQYCPAIERFLVAGAYDEGEGFAYLVDDEGNIAARNTSSLPIVRESEAREGRS